MTACDAPEPVAADAPLLRAYRAVVDALDTDRRAWIIGLARLVDDAGVATPTRDVCRLIREDVAGGVFPTGPIPLGVDDLVVDCVCPMGAHAKAELPGGRQLAYRISGGHGWVAVALTRNGHLDDGTCRPGHVQLADAESVLVDTVTLVEYVAGTAGHVDRCHVAVGIACDVPGQPLELRVYDEDGGELLRPPSGYDEFDTVYAQFRTGLSAEDRDVWLWDTALSIAVQFGVFEPQMVRHPLGSARAAWRVGPR